MILLRFDLVIICLILASSCKQSKVEVDSNVEVSNNTPPNILLIVSDDQGFQDIGCYGSEEVITPNLDRLAREGVRLTNFYVTWPYCTPSRGSYLSGRYPQRNGMFGMLRNEAPDYGYQYQPGEHAFRFERVGGMDQRERLLPELLKEAGYVSGIYGKWDLGTRKRFLPLAKGFDDFYGFIDTGIDYYTHERYGVPSMYKNNQITVEDKGIYCTYLFVREAKRFLKENHQKPLFLYLPFNAPHNASSLDPKIRCAAQAPEEFKNMYPHLKDGYMLSNNESPVENLVPSKEKQRLEYLASITCMDHAIGEILGLLDQYNISDNTMVIFFSDNGGANGSDNTPLRGGKGQLWEGGIRVPCIIRYPMGIRANQFSHEFLTTLEVVPTLVSLAKIALPEDIIFDGFDMLPVLRGEFKSPRKNMFWKVGHDRAARVENWKWIEGRRGSGLFNLAHDVGETNDLSEKYPKKLVEMKAQFDNWEKEMEQAEPRGPFRDY